MVTAKRPARRRPLGVGKMRAAHQIWLRTRTIFSFSLISAERWDRSRHLRGLLTLGLIYCTLGGAGNWYNWSNGKSSLYFPILLTLGAMLILIAAPRKWDLITLSAGGVFVLAVLGTLLHRGQLPLGLELALIVATGAVFFTCEYVRTRLQRASRDRATERNTARGE